MKDFIAGLPYVGDIPISGLFATQEPKSTKTFTDLLRRAQACRRTSGTSG